MCGRYVLTTPAEAMRQVFRFTGPTPNLRARYNIAPTQDVPIVRRAQGIADRELAMVHWGLIPFWAKEKSIGYKMINARAESVATKPSFKNAFRKRRCLVPADGFYEWQKTDGRKQPIYIRLKSGGPLAFAGLWETWQNPEDGVELQSCTIITCDPNPIMAPIHNRMPVILDPADYERWLDPAASDGANLLKACPGEWLETLPVSTFVNSPKNDGPECIEPLRERSPE